MRWSVKQQQKHSIILQMIYSLIPLVNVWAFSRIEKLRVYVGVIIIDGIFVMTVYEFFGEAAIVEIFLWIIGIIIYPLLMRHYTIKWNNLDTIRRKGSFASDDNF